MDDLKAKRIYRIVSIIILAFCAYFFLLPVISSLMEKILPGLWTCPFLRITGKECPFCGITRGIGSLYRLETGSANIISMVAFMAVLAETAFRTILLIGMTQMKRRALETVVFSDVIYHLLLVIGLTVYVIMYLLNNF